MRKTLTILAFGLFLVSLSATAAAQDEPTESAAPQPGFQDLQREVQSVGDIEVSVGSKSIVISWQGITLGANVSTWLRDKVDGLAEEDGNVTQEEADSAELLLREFIQKEFRQYAHDERLNGYLLIDQSNPSGAVVNNLVAEGIEGPVVSAEGIRLSFVTTIAFETRSADVHTVKLDMGRYYFRAVDTAKAQDLVGDFTLTVQGASGWAIDPATVQPGCAAEKLADGKMVFTVDDVNCFTGRSGVLMSFSITGKDDTSSVPGFGGAFLALGLLVAAVALRRRL
ncbi:MAG: hypothetical protein ACRDH5_07920 [bacterium]